MPRKIKDRTRATFTKDMMKNALKLHFEDKLSLRRAANESRVKFQTLHRYVKRLNQHKILP